MEDEHIFNGSIKKALRVLVIAIGFVGLGLWLTTREPVVGWITVAFFGLGIPVSLIIMRPNSTYLRLHSKGFEMAGGWRITSMGWCDVDRFLMANVSGSEMIAIIYSTQYKSQQAARSVSSALTDIEGGIADLYTAPLEEVCDTLNEWRLRFGQRSH